MTHFPITTLYAIPLAALLLILTVNVIRTRARYGLGFGDGGHTDLQQHVRRHGNFAEYTPVFLILLMLAESAGTSPLWLHIAGSGFTIGRFLHPFGLKAEAPAHPLRVVGATIGLLAIAILIVALVRSLAGL